MILLKLANFIAAVAFTLYVVFLRRLDGIPHSVLVLDGVIYFSAMAGARFMTRAVRENYLPLLARQRNQTVRILIIGAGFAGQAIAKEIRQNSGLHYQVVGFIDDDPDKQGSASPVFRSSATIDNWTRPYGGPKPKS